VWWPEGGRGCCVWWPVSGDAGAGAARDIQDDGADGARADGVTHFGSFAFCFATGAHAGATGVHAGAAGVRAGAAGVHATGVRTTGVWPVCFQRTPVKVQSSPVPVQTSLLKPFLAFLVISVRVFVPLGKHLPRTDFKGIHRYPKISVGPSMPLPLNTLRAATPETALQPLQG
jgi:hypothetical protein